MTILHDQNAWHELARWNQPCGRPTYRHAVLELSPGLVADGIAIAVAYDQKSMLWNAVDPDDQGQLESLWSGFVIEGNPVPFITCDEHEFFVAFHPGWGASAGAAAAGNHRNPEAAAPVVNPSPIEAGHALLRLWDSYDDPGPVPMDDAIAELRAAPTNAAANVAADNSPTLAEPA